MTLTDGETAYKPILTISMTDDPARPVQAGIADEALAELSRTQIVMVIDGAISELNRVREHFENETEKCNH